MPTTDEDGCCHRSAHSRHLMSFSLLFFIISFVVPLLNMDKEDCNCDELYDILCCKESTYQDACDTDQCYCTWMNDREGDGQCKTRDKSVNDTARLASLSFWVAGIVLAILGFLSCCRHETKKQKEEMPEGYQVVPGQPETSERTEAETAKV